MCVSRFEFSETGQIGRDGTLGLLSRPRRSTSKDLESNNRVRFSRQQTCVFFKHRNGCSS